MREGGGGRGGARVDSITLLYFILYHHGRAGPHITKSGLGREGTVMA